MERSEVVEDSYRINYLNYLIISFMLLGLILRAPTDLISWPLLGSRKKVAQRKRAIAAIKIGFEISTATDYPLYSNSNENV